MPPILGAKTLYSIAIIAAPINVMINAIIGHTIIRYRAPIAVIELATEFTTAVVLLFNAIIVVVKLYNAEYPIMNQMIPARNVRIREITDIIKEKATTGKDSTSLTSPIFLTSPLYFILKLFL
jgi:hypothetical protein